MNTKKNQYMPLIYFTITLLASFMQGTVSADEWLPASTKNGVQTFLRSVEHSKYKAVRGEAVLPVNVAKLVAVINDAPACPEWADLCAESYIQQQPSDQEAFIYTHNDMAGKRPRSSRSLNVEQKCRGPSNDAKHGSRR